MSLQYEQQSQINFRQEENTTNGSNNSTPPRESKKRRSSALNQKEEKSKPSKKPKPGNRKDNSLNRLTARFMNIIYSSENGTVDLNNASTLLKVQKRRIYDITNVLEGVGLIEKKSKNNIVWSGNFGSTEYQEQVIQLREELLLLREEDRRLDQKLRETQQESKQILQQKSSSAFVTHEDVRNLAGMEDQTIIAVRAQTGTRLEVPDPDFGQGAVRKYQIYLKSDHPIDMHLVSPDEDQNSSNSNKEFQAPQFAEPPPPNGHLSGSAPLNQAYGVNQSKFGPPPPIAQNQALSQLSAQFEMPPLGLGLGLEGTDYFMGHDVCGSISEFYDDDAV